MKPALLRSLAPGLLAAAAFALAFASPVEEVDSDPGIALLAAQSLLDHGTLDLAAYAGDPALAYDLESDYRVRRRGGARTYYAHGVSLLSLPAVWLANRAGFHMLDRDDEYALQNLLSALACALLAVVLYRLCRVYLKPGASLAIAAVTLFGSSLVSTLATALWNTCYQQLFLGLGVLHLARRDDAAERPNAAYLALLAALAFLCRPTAAFAVLAAAVAFAPAALKRRSAWLPLALGLALAAALAVALDLAGWIPRYYSPLKLTPRTPLATGLYGVLLSPSRGLLVFSPFLVPVAVVCLRYLRALAARRTFRLAAVWIALHTLAIATRGNWWGGHSYGPRLATELMLPALVATCLAWRQLGLRARPRARALAAAAYLACGLWAVYVHSYQGLFNHDARRWNFTPDVDRDPGLAFDWRHPQFLASAASLEERDFEHRRRTLGTYRLGEAIPFDGDRALFRDWYLPEPGWRWSRGTRPEIILRLGALPAPGPYLLRLRAASLGPQEIGLAVNGTPAGTVELDGAGVRERAFAFGRDALRAGAENVLRFDVPGASSTPTDDRVLGLALHQLSLDALPADFGVDFDDEPFFVAGWSAAERAWRWSDGRRAAIDYPAGGTADLDALVLTASALVPQPVGVTLNGVEVGELRFEGGFEDVAARRLAFDPGLLRPDRMNRIELSLPRARPTAADARLLGIALRRLELRQGNAEVLPARALR